MNKSKITPIFFVLLTSVLLLGCRTIGTIPGSHSQNNTVITRSDTVHHLDSVFIEHWNTIIERGDTVYISKVEKEEKVKWRVRTHTDTFLVEKTDSILVPVPVEKVVEKHIVPSWVGWSLALNAVLVLGIVWLFRRRRL